MSGGYTPIMPPNVRHGSLAENRQAIDLSNTPKYGSSFILQQRSFEAGLTPGTRSPSPGAATPVLFPSNYEVSLPYQDQPKQQVMPHN